MSRTQTIFVDLSRLLFQKEKASLIIRLMMACNDISLANQCLGKHKEDQGRMSKHAQQGALMYFVRLQCGIKRDVRYIFTYKNRCDINPVCHVKPA